MENKEINKSETENVQIEFPIYSLFGERESIYEAFKYAEMFNDNNVLICMYVLYNTIAKNYYMINKESFNNNKYALQDAINKLHKKE